MRLAITALVFLSGLFFILLGLSFLFQPSVTVSSFGLSADGPVGLATLRADLFPFFTFLGVCMIWGAWKRRGDLLLLPAIVLLLALIGRLVSGVLDGAGDNFIGAALIEAGMVVLLFLARSILPHHRVQDVGD
ncbi:hypothetical protein MB02_02030 [Croceicoccus estronivorus]|uniref:DUF4345 family protein n=1 Tax=Croceicoccus estronivorus TaxID=1172626 RepID=UPI00082ED705|nr:DUF4345 family protein [Croceicoccus estronivorus]OCC25450.1 hypothetical protein MB02_02030 [Croceicoccus estronivorus]